MSRKAQKTIVMTLGRGLLVRNFLRTSFISHLLSKVNIHLVILTPGFNDRGFLKEFSHPRITFLDLPTPPQRRADQWMNRIQAAMVFTETTQIKLKRRIYRQKAVWLIYGIRWLCANTLGRLRSVRRFLSWLETKVLHNAYYDEIVKTHRPDLVFITSLMNLPDNDMARAARQHRVPIVGMCKSWDNLLKDIPIRIRPDTLVVWNAMMERQAITTQLLDKRTIIKTGIPQFDNYFTGEYTVKRNTFLASMGARKHTKIICFASAGSLATSDQRIITLLLEMIRSGKLGYDCILIIRPHFCYPQSIVWYDAFKDNPDVILQTTKNSSTLFPDAWDPKQDDIKLLSQTMQHADVFITSPSTLVLDRACFNKPIINVGFNAIEDRPTVFSMMSYYGTGYYREVLDYNATWFAADEKQLCEAIRTYLDNPDLHSEQRLHMCSDFCYKQDGKSAERIAKVLLERLR